MKKLLIIATLALTLVGCRASERASHNIQFNNRYIYDRGNRKHA